LEAAPITATEQHRHGRTREMHYYIVAHTIDGTRYIEGEVANPYLTEDVNDELVSEEQAATDPDLGVALGLPREPGSRPSRQGARSRNGPATVPRKTAKQHETMRTDGEGVKGPIPLLTCVDRP
jgi:hypothetical protein